MKEKFEFSAPKLNSVNLVLAWNYATFNILLKIIGFEMDIQCTSQKFRSFSLQNVSTFTNVYI